MSNIGNSVCQMNCGVFLYSFENQGIEENLKERAHLLKSANLNGDADNENIDVNHNPNDPVNYEDIYPELQNKTADERDEFLEGLEIIEKNTAKGFLLNKAAADSGFWPAMLTVANCSFRGLGTPKDYGNAVKWYKRAASFGSGQAWENLGFCYLRGYGIPESKKKALECFRNSGEVGNKAGLKGYLDAVQNIGTLQNDNLGWEYDDEDFNKE